MVRKAVTVVILTLLAVPREAVADDSALKTQAESLADDTATDDDATRAAFIPHEANQTCEGDIHSVPWTKKVIGVNLGGWMVLEPWITPSLFYQFLGGHSDTTAMDSHSFCRVLGPEEGNRQLRLHWASWVTEAKIAELASYGVNCLRIPLGDWLFAPYHPFVGCYDGALEFVDDAIKWAKKYGLTVLFDVHAVRRSANGLDNGGVTMGVKWTSTLKDVASDAVTFEHWPRRDAAWMGTFDKHTGLYTPDVNWTRIEDTLDVISEIATRFADEDTVIGIEPVNEPWQFTPIDVLKTFYWKAYLRVKAIAPRWRFVMHDSFRFDVNVWGGFMRGCPDIALDTHIYQAWFEPSVRDNFYANACAQKAIIQKMEEAFGPVIVGEWSLATDNCAMWLNGFNDNLPGYPKLPCKYVKCAEPYFPDNHNIPNTPPSILKSLQGPFGTGVSGPLYGLCPVDRDWLRTSPAEAVAFSRKSSDLDAEARGPEVDDTDTVMQALALKKLQAFSSTGHGFFFWNFRTELEDQWSFSRAVRRGWLPSDFSDLETLVADACDKEDVHCRSNPDASDRQIERGALYAAAYLNDAELARKIRDAATSDALRDAANRAFDAYWIARRGAPTTSGVAHLCNFSGAAELTKSHYKCVARRVDETAVRDGMAYCVGFDPDTVAKFATLHGDALWRVADDLFDSYWETYRYAGATCDFGGGGVLLASETAQQLELNVVVGKGDHHSDATSSTTKARRRRVAHHRVVGLSGSSWLVFAALAAMLATGLATGTLAASATQQQGWTYDNSLSSSREDPGNNGASLLRRFIASRRQTFAVVEPERAPLRP